MIEKTRLANGVQVVTHAIPGARGAALAVWMLHGARHAGSGESGYAHLCEHLLFKAARDSGAGLAARLDALGGEVNGHTGRELSAVFGVVLGEDLRELGAVLAAQVVSPGFDDLALANERRIVLQELAEVDGAETSHQAATRRAWGSHPLAQPILGTRDSLSAANAERLRAYWSREVTGGRICVAAAGSCTHDEVVDSVRALLALPVGEPRTSEPPGFTDGERRWRVEGAHSQLLWVLPAPAVGAPEHLDALAANLVLGGCLSSRLFQSLRECHGLVYGVRSQVESYSDAGLWFIETRCPALRSDECRTLVERELDKLAAAGPTDAEMETARRYLRARLLLQEHEPLACVERLGQEAIYLGAPRGADAVLAQLPGLTAKSAAEALRAARARTLFLAAIGES